MREFGNHSSRIKHSMPSPNWLDFARLCAASYEVGAGRVTGGWSRVWFGAINDGFKGARYQRANGGRLDEVCAFAGTDSAADALADVGFGAGGAVAAVATTLSPALGILISAGRSGLSGQMTFALEMVRQAQWNVGRTGGALYITGHSLGGGLAQIVAAELGGKAAPISSPAVSQLPGLLGRYTRNAPTITNLRVNGDPINATEVLGSRLGTTVRLATGRGVTQAHFIGGTVTDLEATGCATTLGATCPF